MLPYIDAHCHLDLFQNIKNSVKYEDGLPIKTLTVTNAPFLLKHNELIFKDCHNIRIALGLHPELASKYGDEISLFKSLCKDARYIGEIGLDGSNNYKESWGIQLKIFREILQTLIKLDRKILSVHSRNATFKTIEELKVQLTNTDHKVILHWFSGTLEDLNFAIQEGFYFSINHKMLTSRKGIEIVKKIPIDKVLTETDAPFTFDPLISTREESLKSTVSSLSNIWKTNSMEAKDTVYQNFRNLLESKK